MLNDTLIPIHLEDSNVAELLRTSLQPLVEQAARLRIDLRVATLGSIPRVRVDREKLAWSVTALVGNALRHVTPGTEASVGGSVVVHVTPSEIFDGVAISVQDDGPGIAADSVPFLFKRRRGATHAEGLALSLVRQIAIAHGGGIEVETRCDPDDHGTSITLELPARSVDSR